MVDLKRETVNNISELRNITGQTDEEIVSNAVENYIRKKVSPMIGTCSITFFGMVIYISHLILNINL